jgi:AcrR family transcriptional regulator
MISDLATGLFIERGYAVVTTAEIAEKAEVSVPTLFNYFPTKETLVFDEDQEREEKLVRAVTARKKGTPILEALHDLFVEEEAFKPGRKRHLKAFVKLIDSTPELTLYAKQMWLRHEQALAAAIQKESKTKIGQIEAEAIAHFVLDAFYRSLQAPDPQKTLISLLEILKTGWNK